MIDFIYLQSGERPSPDEHWLLIVKIHDQDYELIVSRDLEVVTLGAYASLQAAQDHAIQAAEFLKIGTVYVLGAPSA